MEEGEEGEESERVGKAAECGRASEPHRQIDDKIRLLESAFRT